MVRTVARWIAVLPAATVSAYLAWLLVSVGNRLTIGRFIDEESLINNAFIETVSNGAMGAAFVYAGSRVAPFHQREVAFVLGGLALALAGLMLWPAIQTAHYIAIWGIICLMIGAGCMTYQVASGEKVF